jgi:Holliday junction DNA helicase RuvA
MIEYVKGDLTELTPAMAVVEAGGVGYGLNISLNTYTAVQGKKEVKLFVYEAVREDAYVLFGFSTRQERDLFLLLISVSGSGSQYCTYDTFVDESFRTVRPYIHRQ